MAGRLAQHLAARLRLPPEDQPAARVLAITAWLVVGLSAVAVALDLAGNLTVLAGLDLAGGAAAVWALRHLGAPRRAAVPLLWTLTFTLSLGSLATTPSDPMVLCYLFVLPLLSANVLPGQTRTWFFRVMAAGAAALAASAQGWTVPVTVDGTVFKAATSFVGALFGSMALLGAQARTSRLSEERLKEAERAKTAFFANLSHEIRTPMNGVLGMTDALLLRPLPAEEEEMVRTIRSSGAVMLALVDELLDHAKLEAGRLVLHPGPLPLEPLAAELRALWQPTAARKGLALEVTVGPALPRTVLLDAQRVRQILHNLVSNALKFTSAGGVVVRFEEAGGRLRLAVEDTGIGIPAAQLERLFTRFGQADDDRARRDQGAGLGLALARELARLMEGGLEVASTPGRGSCFTCTLPLVPVAAVAAAPAPAAVPPGLKVLVVDDNPVNRLVAQRLLERVGCQVVLSEDGHGALAVLQDRRDLDVVLMDVHMPDLDGLEVTRRARARHGAGSPRIIGCSASAELADLESCRQAGMDGFLAKPLTRERLVEALLRQAPAARAP